MKRLSPTEKRRRSRARRQRAHAASHAAPKRPPPKWLTECQSCNKRFETAAKANSHRRSHGPYTYRGFAIRRSDAGDWIVIKPGGDALFRTKAEARFKIDMWRGGASGSVHTVSGGLPSLGKL
jgi:hypothetical protein